MDDIEYTIRPEGNRWRWMVSISVESVSFTDTETQATQKTLHELRRLREDLDNEIQSLEARLRNLTGSAE